MFWLLQSAVLWFTVQTNLALQLFKLNFLKRQQALKGGQKRQHFKIIAFHVFQRSMAVLHFNVAITHHTEYSCSLPLWRVHGIKRTYLAPRIHGLFITQTQFRLLTILAVQTIIMHIYTIMIIITLVRQSVCTCIQVDTQLWRNPLAFCFPFLIPLCFSSITFYLLGNPPRCVRIPSTLVPGCS